MNFICLNTVYVQVYTGVRVALTKMSDTMLQILRRYFEMMTFPPGVSQRAFGNSPQHKKIR